MITKIVNSYRITIPKEMRENIKEGDLVRIDRKGYTFVITVLDVRKREVNHD